MKLKGQAIIDATSLTKREGMPSSPVALSVLNVLRHPRTLFSDTTEKEWLSSAIPLLRSKLFTKLLLNLLTLAEDPMALRRRDTGH